MLLSNELHQCLVGVTGSPMSFKEDIRKFLNGQMVAVSIALLIQVM